MGNNCDSMAKSATELKLYFGLQEWNRINNWRRLQSERNGWFETLSYIAANSENYIVKIKRQRHEGCSQTSRGKSPP
jgi:hypothetical protein